MPQQNNAGASRRKWKKQYNRKGRPSGDPKGVIEKTPDESRKRELSAQLPVRQEVSPKQQRKSLQKERKLKKKKKQLQEVSICSFGSTKSGVCGREGGREREGGEEGGRHS